MAWARRTRWRMPFGVGGDLAMRRRREIDDLERLPGHLVGVFLPPCPNSTRPVRTNSKPVVPRGAESYCVAYPVIDISCSGSRGESPRTVMLPRSG